MEDQNQPTQTPPSPNQTPSPLIDSNPSKSKVILIILGIAAAIVITIGAYVLGTKQSQPIVQNIAQTTPIPSPTPVDETANWKTYNEETYKFLVKYPDDWIFKTYYLDVNSIYDKKYLKDILIVNFKNKKTTYEFEINTPGLVQLAISYIKPSVSFEDVLTQDKNDYGDVYPKPLLLFDHIVNANGIQAHKFTYKYTGHTYNFVYIPREDGSVYRIAGSVGNEDFSLQEKFLDQMLSTFQFTN